MHCSKFNITSEEYSHRRIELRKAMGYLDEAAQYISVFERSKAARLAIASLTGLELSNLNEATLCNSWMRFTETTLYTPLAAMQIQNAHRIVSDFIILPTSISETKRVVGPQDFPIVLQAVERIIIFAIKQNELKKPLQLRLKTRLAFLKMSTAILGMAGIVYVLWIGYMWFSPTGMRITYFNGKNFEHPIAYRVGQKTSLDYGADRPAWGIRRKNWSARWEGYLLAPTDAEYSFYMQSMAGARMYIDNQCVINNWHEQSWASSGRHTNLRLNKGPHRLALEHYNATGPAAIRVRWMGGGIPANSIIEKPYLRKYE